MLQLDLQPRICCLRVLDLPLLERQLLFLVLVLRCCWQVVLADHGLLHVLEESGDRGLVLRDLLLVGYLFFFETLHELVDFALFLVQYLVLLGFPVLATSGGSSRFLFL